MAADKLQDHLAYPPRTMDAERAAAYVGFGRTKFLEMVVLRKSQRSPGSLLLAAADRSILETPAQTRYERPSATGEWARVWRALP